METKEGSLTNQIDSYLESSKRFAENCKIQWMNENFYIINRLYPNNSLIKEELYKINELAISSCLKNANYEISKLEINNTIKLVEEVKKLNHNQKKYFNLSKQQIEKEIHTLEEKIFETSVEEINHLLEVGNTEDSIFYFNYALNLSTEFNKKDLLIKNLNTIYFNTIYKTINSLLEHDLLKQTKRYITFLNQYTHLLREEQLKKIYPLKKEIINKSINKLKKIKNEDKIKYHVSQTINDYSNLALDYIFEIGIKDYQKEVLEIIKIRSNFLE